MKVSAYLFLFLMMFARPSQANTQQLLQLIDYVGVDYSGAVIDGQVVNPAEYDEMLDFSAGISQQLADLPAHEIKAELTSDAQTLAGWVKQKESGEKIRRLTAQMHQKIISAYQIMVVPRKQPDLEKAQLLYASQCASCHGEEGLGDGPEAIDMMPLPINFHDVERYQQRTLYGLHSTITQGVDGTSMKAFAQLSDEDRWSLAFYVGNMAVAATDIDVEKLRPVTTR